MSFTSPLTTLEEVEHLHESLISRYPTPPRVVVIVGDPGWIAIRKLFDNQWKGVPVLIDHARKEVPENVEALISRSKGVTKLTKSEQLTEGYNVTTLEKPLFIGETISMMYELLPNMKKLAFIHDNRYISLSIKQELAKVAKERFPDIQVEYLLSPEMSTEELLNTVSAYDSSVGLIYYSWFTIRSDSSDTYLNNNIHRVLYGVS